MKNEYLLINKFESVFEAMIDELLGNDVPPYLNISKKQEDGKRLDHLYSGPSLLDGSKNKVYYIGDSKYYLDETDIEANSTSVAKEYTYAKNIIQYVINDYLKTNNDKGFKYRDDDTEGYTVTPNFFLRGAIHFEDGRISNYDEEAFIREIDNVRFEKNRQFNDRLFDRDTLLLKAFNINFLTLLSLYIADETPSKRGITKDKIRKCLLTGLSKQYDFYKVYPVVPSGKTTCQALKDMSAVLFRDYIGTMFHDNSEDAFIWFAFSKDPKEKKHHLSSLKTDLDNSKLIVTIEKAEYKDDSWTYSTV